MAVPVANGGAPSAKRRLRRARRRGRAASDARRGVALAVCAFASFWGALILYLHASIGGGGGGAAEGGGAGGGGSSSSSGGGNGRDAEAAAGGRGGAAAAMAGAGAGVGAGTGPNDAAARAVGGDSSSAEAHALALMPAVPNPHEGWQPPISDSTGECSWRECFKKVHTCPLCRDLDAQLGTSVPDAPDNWIPDVTMLRRMYLRGRDAAGNPWPPPLPPELCEDIAFDGGRKGDINKRCLETIPVAGEPLGKSEARARSDGLSNGKVAPEGTPMPRLMCLVYTMASEHPTRIRAIRETWGGGCDGFLAFSTASDPRIPAISLPHEGPEEYGNMWQKVRSIWRFVGTHYLGEFDYFFIGGDDLLVMPQNLREYLWTLGSPENDHFVGRRFKSSVYFNSGGAGYALSRGTLRKFVEHMEDARCNPRGHTSMEDVMIARCLDALGIKFTDTRDNEGRERFHPFAPGSHLTWDYPKNGGTDWYEQYNKEWGLKLGKDCCAPDSVSWHYMKKPAMVRHIYSLLYLCDDRGGGNLRKRNAS